MATATIIPNPEAPIRRALAPGEKLEAQYRTVSAEIVRVKRDAADPDNDGDIDTIELSFASDATAVDRWWGLERLVVSRKAMGIDRLNASAPFLSNHNPDDQVGVVVPGSLRFAKDKDGVNRAYVKVMRGNSAVAKDVWPDIVADPSIRPNVSFAYIINEMVLAKASDEGNEYDITDYDVLEVSSVTVPADYQVGYGRSKVGDEKFPLVVRGAAPAKAEPVIQTERTIMPEPIAITPSAEEIRSAALTGERSRVANIRTYCTAALLALGGLDNSFVDRCVADGSSEDETRSKMLDAITKKSAERTVPTATDIGLTERENQRYSVRSAILHMAARAGYQDVSAVDAGLEREVSATIAKRLGKEPGHGGMYIPSRMKTNAGTPNEQLREAIRSEFRTLNVVGGGSGGGYGVGTDFMAEDFIELLRNQMFVRRMGARVLSDLTEYPAFPKQLSAGTLYWTTEAAAAISQSDLSLGLITLSPKTAMSGTSYTRQLLNQSSLDVESLVRQDLAAITALGIDLASIAGPGSGGAPTGILTASGTNLEALGTNGAIPTFANLVDMETALLQNNVPMTNIGWMLTPGLGGLFKKTARLANTIGGAVYENGKIIDYPVGVTNQVPNGLTKGTSSSCHAMILGAWINLMIGEWGAYELVVDPFSKKYQAIIEVASFAMVDIALRYAQAFTVCKDALIQ